MTVFVDTSVLVAAFVAKHQHHGRSKAAVLRVEKGMDQGYLAAHSLAELYATLTGIIKPPRHAPRTVEKILRENVLAHFKPLYLKPDDYLKVISRLAMNKIMGGILCDALIFEAATKVDFDWFLPINLTDFRRVAEPNLVKRIREP